MTDGASQLMDLLHAIAAADRPAASALLAHKPALATAVVQVGASRRDSEDYFLTDVGHYIYGGDTALHIAGAGYQLALARELIAAGADVHARNRRGATALHYAADGAPGSPHWNPPAQAATITALIEAGADPNERDRGAVAPLHRAVRTRCAGAVRALLDHGADPNLTNGNGSTPLALAMRTTGRGGSGSPEAKAQREQIVGLLQGRGALA